MQNNQIKTPHSLRRILATALSTSLFTGVVFAFIINVYPPTNKSEREFIATLNYPGGIGGLQLGTTKTGVWTWQGQTIGTGKYKKILSSLFAETSYTGPGSPLVIDLGGNGLQTSSVGVGVDFDLFNVGEKSKIQWLIAGSDDSFLALDINEDGVINDGGELFGEGTWLVNAENKAKHGYEALAQYDTSALGGNEDGAISAKDEIWNQLVLWNDANADGLSQRNELVNVDRGKFKRIQIAYKTYRKNYIDDSGNYIPYWSWVKLYKNKSGDTQKAIHKRPNRLKMYDVFFAPIFG